jgi:hypothetical protein
MMTFVINKFRITNKYDSNSMREGKKVKDVS